MSLDVALQSVAFYVLSCSTCAKISHRRKARAQAKRERVEKLALEVEQPGLYRHPSPFSTNPYWTEEIMMGPGPPPKRPRKKHPHMGVHMPELGPESSANSYTISTGAASSPTAVEGSRTSGEGWNRRRYQREDEALWGHDILGPGQRIIDAIARAGSTAGRLLEGRLNRDGASDDEEEDSLPYSIAKNPPVNELHPPVVSTRPASKDQTRWMLQPPPPAKVMEGKERVQRGRAVSAGSSRRGPDSLPLSRQGKENVDHGKAQRADADAYVEIQRVSSGLESESRTPPKASRTKGQRYERSTSPALESSESDVTTRRRKTRPSSISISPALSSPDTVEHIPIPTPPATLSADPQQRPVMPPLGKRTSSSSSIPQAAKEKKDTKQVLRELSPPSSNSALNSRVSSSANRLMPNANSMPATIPGVDSKFPSVQTSIYSKSAAVKNIGPLGPSTGDGTKMTPALEGR